MRREVNNFLNPSVPLRVFSVPSVANLSQRQNRFIALKFHGVIRQRFLGRAFDNGAVIGELRAVTGTTESGGAVIAVPIDGATGVRADRVDGADLPGFGFIKQARDAAGKLKGGGFSALDLLKLRGVFDNETVALRDGLRRGFAVFSAAADQNYAQSGGATFEKMAARERLRIHCNLIQRFAGERGATKSGYRANKLDSRISHLASRICGKISIH